MTIKYAERTWLRLLDSALIVTNTRQSIATSLESSGFVDTTCWAIRAHLLPTKLPITQRDRIQAIGEQVAARYVNNVANRVEYLREVLDECENAGVVSVHKNYRVSIQISLFDYPSHYEFSTLGLHLTVDGKRRKLHSEPE